MTREERLAAGWVECWGVFDWADGRWMGEGHNYWEGPRKNYEHPKAASAQAATYSLGKIVARRFWRRKKPKVPPPLAAGHFDVKQREVLGRWMVCGKCGEKHENLYARKELRHKGRTVGSVGVMFNVDEKCRVVRMDLLQNWNEDL